MKPCPFCGFNKVEAIACGETSTPYFYAYCEKCNAAGPAVDAKKGEGWLSNEEGEALALQKWDERAA